jgi:hypothetical protein
MSALDRIVGAEPLLEPGTQRVAQLGAHCEKLVVPPTGSDRLPDTLVSVPDHEIDPHVTDTDPDDE